MSTCVWQTYDPQYCLQSKLGSNTKRNQSIINKSNQKENKNWIQIPYEYKIGDQAALDSFQLVFVIERVHNVVNDMLRSFDL
jgi:hypothetical protein